MFFITKCKAIFYWLGFKGAVIIIAAVFGTLSIFVFWDFIFNEQDSMQICRVMSVIAAIGMFLCSGLICVNIYKTHYPSSRDAAYQILLPVDNEKNIYPIQMSVKLFLFVMTFVSLTGYFLRAPYIYVLMDFDFALNYSNKSLMLWADGFFIVAILIYFPLQLFYLWFYMRDNGLFQYLIPTSPMWHTGVKVIFAITLLSNFWQKWLFESLVAHEKLCEIRHEKNESCWGHREYHSDIFNMSEAEQEAFHSMEMVSPMSYSCTMEVLAVYLVVLCFPKIKQRRRHHARRRSSRNINFDVNKSIACLIEIVMILMLASIGFGLWIKIVTLYHDHEHDYIKEIEIRNYLKVAWNSLEVAAFVGCMHVFWRLDMNRAVEQHHDANQPSDLADHEIQLDDGPVRTLDNNYSEYFSSCWASVKKFFTTKWFRAFLFLTSEPDLVILQMTFWSGVIGFTIRFILHFISLLHGESELSIWIFSILPSFLGYVAAGMNLILLHLFLTKKSNLQPLYSNTFTRFMIPWQIVRCFARAAYYYALNLDPNVPLPKNEESFWVLTFNAAYPFAPLMYITSGLCWSHVLGKFFSNGSYSTAINDDDYTSVPSEPSPRQSRAESILHNIDPDTELLR